MSMIPTLIEIIVKSEIEANARRIWMITSKKEREIVLLWDVGMPEKSLIGR